MNGNVTALIFCGGKATRLRPILQGKPKALIEVSGKPFIIRLIKFLSSSGIKNICLSLSDSNESIVQVVKSEFGNEINLIVSYDSGCIENAGALNTAINFCRTDLILAINGDTFLDIDISKFISAHVKSKHIVMIAVSNRADQPLAHNISLNKNSITSYSTETKQGKNYTHCNTGWAIIERKRYLQHDASNLRVGKLEQDVYPGMADEGFLGAYDCEQSYVLDIGTPFRYMSADNSETLPW